MRRQPPPLVQTLALGLAAVSLSAAHAQRSIASVPTAEATLSGPSIIQGPDTVLRADGLQNQPDEIAAQAHPAHLKLVRGGTLLLCQASALTLTSTQNLPQLLKDTFDPLLVTLTRGAMEIAMPLLPGDTLVTPEMRLESASYKARAVPLDLAVHVDGNGDTCVENHAEKSSPVIVSDVFGASRYTLKPGDHVLFQHGMVDSAIAPSDRPCGCPPPSAGPSSLGLQSAVDGTPRPGFDPSSAAFPFPIVASQKNAVPLDQAPATAPSSSQVGLQASLTYEAPAVATPAAPPPAQPIAPVPAPTVPGLPPALIISAPPQTQPAQPVSLPPPAIPRPLPQEAHLEPPPALVVVLPPETLAASPTPARKLPVNAPKPPAAKAVETKPIPAPPVQPPVAAPMRPAAEPIIVYVPPAPKPAPPALTTPAATPAPAAPQPARPKHGSKPKGAPAPPAPGSNPAEAPKPPRTEPSKIASASPTKPQPAEQSHGVVGSVTSASRTVGRSIGHFFKRLFTQ